MHAAPGDCTSKRPTPLPQHSIFLRAVPLLTSASGTLPQGSLLAHRADLMSGNWCYEDRLIEFYRGTSLQVPTVDMCPIIHRMLASWNFFSLCPNPLPAFPNKQLVSNLCLKVQTKAKKCSEIWKTQTWTLFLWSMKYLL